mmetsp:Transcript_33479/g.80861  ORF Transcript_33479/g.80861 Transcript_33479/m.80861 type:complete len:376 (+) Transcript_33479:54-1181(+)
MHRMQTKTVLAVGDTGAGKSFLLNLLVGRTAFHSSNALESVTKDCQMAAVWDAELGVEFKFIDTPGINDTEMTPDTVRDRLWEFGYWAPEGVHAVLVVIPRGRFNETVHKDLVTLQSFFGDHIWQHSIVVYNQTETRPETIWGDTKSKWQSPWIRKWKAARTSICTVDEVRKDADKQPIKDDRTLQAVRDLLQAIVTREEPYRHDAFEKARQEKVTLTQQAMSDLKTVHWRREMQKTNDELMEGRMSRERWFERVEEITAGDLVERKTQEREQQERAEKQKAQKEAEEERKAKVAAQEATATAKATAEEARKATEAAKQKAENMRKEADARRSSWNVKVAVGTVVGAVGGALVGGPLGALAGAAACGAGTGAISK